MYKRVDEILLKGVDFMKKEKQEQQIVKVDKADNETSIEVFGRVDYDTQIERAKKVSEVVSKIVEQKKLYAMIQGKKYVTCEGWTTMGSLLGLFPQIVEVKEEKSEKGIKYIAICEIRTLDGKLVSRAESECASWERNKAKMLEQQGEYAIRSMAETRAVSKAYRICLSWIMTLAGYEPTPAEEVVIDQQVEQTEPVVRKITILDNGEVKIQEKIKEKEEVEEKVEEVKEKKQKVENKYEEEYEKYRIELLNEIRKCYKILLNYHKREEINNWLKIVKGVTLEELDEQGVMMLQSVLNLFKKELELKQKGE